MKKKIILSLLVASVLSAGLMGCGNQSPETPSEVSSAAETSKVSTPQVSSAAETGSTPKQVADVYNSDVKLKEAVKTAISGAIDSEATTDVVINNKDLRIIVDLSKVDPSPLTIKDLAISRTSSITDAILELTDYDSQWNTITVDFGYIGKIVCNKDSIKENEAGGRYFPSKDFILK